MDPEPPRGLVHQRTHREHERTSLSRHTISPTDVLTRALCSRVAKSGEHATSSAVAAAAGAVAAGPRTQRGPAVYRKILA